MEAPKVHHSQKTKHKTTTAIRIGASGGGGIINHPAENDIEEEENLENNEDDGGGGENGDGGDGVGAHSGGGDGGFSISNQSVNGGNECSNKKEELRQRESIMSDDVEAGNDDKIQKGILGYMDRQMKTHKKPQSLSDPQGSPAQRSSRSRSSNDKSPRRKRSKSESRRRRERKLIAAGEMEVRQANETLMRYLKQCSEINDASLSGELEIDKNLEDRKVYRKTKAQRNRRSHHLITSKINGKIPPSDLSTVLNDLGDDIVPHNGEIYNPFTPVVSPTEGPPTRIDKMYIQTPKGYRSVDNTFYKTHIDHYSSEHDKDAITNGVQLACAVQRIWICLSNICHGLLGGLALAHLLFIFTTKPYDWVDGSIKHYSAFAEIYANTFYCLAIICMVSIFDRMDVCHISLSSASDSIQFRWIIIVMIYIGTIVLSLSAESMDERLYLTNFNLTIWEEELESNRILNIWNTLSIARSVGAISGWILIGLSPNDDLLFEHLIELEKYHINSN